MKKTRKWAALCVISGLIVVAGCGSGDRSGNGADAVESFTIALGARPNSLDLTKHFHSRNMGTISLFTETLERLGGDGSLSSHLARNVQEPDEKTIVYTLREDAKFSNGDPLTPADVVWSIEHATDVKGGAQTAAILASVAGVTETGEHEVTVKLNRPDPTARELLALTAFIQNAEFGKAHQDDLGTPAAVPIGTGPYKVTEFNTDAVTMNRNPHYWDDKPVADTLTVSYIDTDNTAQLAMRSEEIQGALVSDATSVPRWEAIDGSKIYSSPALLSHYLCLDTTVAPFDDIHVRKAIAHAIDRKGLLQAAFGGNARVLPALIPDSQLTPVAPSKGAVKTFLDGLPSYDFDMEKAKDELAKSAHPDGFSMSVPYISEEPWSKLTALNLQQNLKPLGVTVTPRAMTIQEWTDGVFSHDTTPVWPMSWAAPLPDPGELPRVVTREAIIDQGAYNFAKWAPAGLREYTEVLDTSADRAARWKAAQGILTEIAADVPYVPLFQPESTLVLAEGFEFTHTPGVIDFANGSWIGTLKPA